MISAPVSDRRNCQGVAFMEQDCMRLDDIRRDQRSEPTNHQDVAGRLAQILKESLGQSIFELWFSQESFSVSDNILTVFCDNEFASRRINNNFGNQLRTAMERACGLDFELRFEIVEADDQTPETEDPVGKTVQRNLLSTENESQPTPPRKKLADFRFGEENQLAAIAVKEVFADPGKFSPLMVHGPIGSGKTHLLRWIVAHARNRRGFRRCVYLSAEQFTSYFLAGLRGGKSLPMFRENYRGLDLLAIDDIQFFEKKNATLNEFQYTIDNLIRNGKQVILSSDRPPFEINEFGNEIRTRISAGLVCPLNYPSAEGRQKILHDFCEQRGFNIPGDVLEFIAEKVARDVRRLSGAINRIHAVSVATQTPITVDLAQEALSDLFSIAGLSTSMHAIEQAVCNFCGVNASELRSSSRKKQISAARMLAMYLSRRHTSSAFSEIGDYFGGRSHSTVIAAQRKVDTWIDDNKAIDFPNAKKFLAKQAISRIESKLGVG